MTTVAKSIFWAEKNGEFIGFIEADSKFEAVKIARYYQAKVVGNSFNVTDRAKGQFKP